MSNNNDPIENGNKDPAFHRLLLALAIAGIFTTSIIFFVYQSAKAACIWPTNATMQTNQEGHAIAESSYAISKVRSGLVASDSLTTGNLKKWVLYGSAIPREAPYTYSENSTGLVLGIKSANSGSYAGYFAETPSTNAYLFHAVLTLPYTTISDHEFNTGLYVQTTYLGLVNYVTCAASVTPSGYSWSVVLATGSQNGADNFTTLWEDRRSGQPLTRDCTIITNGENYLKVYLDGVAVYSSNKLELTMPAPFYAFVEVQTSSSSQMLFASYSDYYSASNNVIMVMNAPAGGIVEIVDASTGKQVSKGTVDDNGTARLEVGRYHMPIHNAFIRIHDTSSAYSIVSNSAELWAGDIYSLASGQTKFSDLSCIPATYLEPI
jgi:hypothetical protein